MIARPSVAMPDFVTEQVFVDEALMYRKGQVERGSVWHENHTFICPSESNARYIPPSFRIAAPAASILSLLPLHIINYHQVTLVGIIVFKWWELQNHGWSVCCPCCQEQRSDTG